MSRSDPTSPTTRTISERLADYILGLQYADIPGPVVDQAKDHFVHHLGIAFRGHGSPRSTKAVKAAYRFGGANGPTTIIGQHSGTDQLAGVFANSVLMGHDGLDDVILPPGVHPGAVIQPVAWAVGQTLRASGRELLTTMIAGYDVIAKLHRHAWTWELNLPRPPQWAIAPFAAAATAARLLGLTHQQTVDAFGHAGQAAAGVYEGVESQWTMHARAACNGVLASLLAKADMPASPTIFEGRHGIYRSFFLEDVPDDVEENLSTLGQEFAISRAEIKRSSLGLINKAPVELTRQLLSDHALSLSDIASVELVLPKVREVREAAYDHADAGGPRYLVATVLAHGHLDRVHRIDSDDASVRHAARKIRIGFEPDRPLRFARVEITTKSGRTHIAEAMTGGAPEAPLDWGRWLHAGQRIHLSDAQLTRLGDKLRHLEDVSDVAEVLACVVPESPS